MTIRSSTRLLTLAAALTLSLGACGAVEKEGAAPTTPKPSPIGDATTTANPTQSEPAPTIATVAEGKLTVCTNPPYAPFEDTVGDQVVGFDMDLMTEVASDMGLKVAFVETPFVSIESAVSLETGSCDVGASALTINPQREAKMRFSEPYYETSLALLVKADSGIATLADLTGKAVGVQQGTTGEDWANDQPELTQIKQYEGLGDQVTALKAGDVAGAFNDEPTLTPYVEEGFTVLGPFAEGESFGFAVKLDNAALQAQINTTLQRVRDDGTYDALIAKWFSEG
ncbi:MAG: transporter substrate-binding domain-containing protein [Bifidobacteriaceae bacterium]|nr:transporter substrate-binding domain-containing protein [Bifidobacteriaceae bacterium]